SAGYSQECKHGCPTAIVRFKIDGDGLPGRSFGERQSTFRLIQATGGNESSHISLVQPAQMNGNRTGSDRRKKIVGILGCQNQNQVRRRLLQSFEKRIRGLRVGAFKIVDQKHAPGSLERLQLGAFFEEAHLRNGDLPQRTVWRELNEIGMG